LITHQWSSLQHLHQIMWHSHSRLIQILLTVLVSWGLSLFSLAHPSTWWSSILEQALRVSHPYTLTVHITISHILLHNFRNWNIITNNPHLKTSPVTRGIYKTLHCDHNSQNTSLWPGNNESILVDYNQQNLSSIQKRMYSSVFFLQQIILWWCWYHD
jgi:hypothetical protein